MSQQKKISYMKKCCFCGSTEDNEIMFGKIYEHDGIVTHYYCLLLSSNMEQRGDDNEGILGFLAIDIRKEIRRGKKLVCSYCKKSGATLGCCNSRCKRIFHMPCGAKSGALNQFFGEFRSFCRTHRPRQKIDPGVKVDALNDALCYICYDTINVQDFFNILWAPCCNKNAWFHKSCVQQLALSAGYFFKCPLCNDKKQFQNAMLQHGIFIPSQDASWELEPNAFQELLHRHDHCDADMCICPKGRKYTSTNAKWELVLCRTCGSQGIHMACGKLKWANPVWECKECCTILHRPKRPVNSEVTMHISNNSDSDSDSDISVGTESTLPDDSLEVSRESFVSPIKLRPGPKSYKIRQVLSHAMDSNSKLENGITSTKSPSPNRTTDQTFTCNSTPGQSSKTENNDLRTQSHSGDLSCALKEDIVRIDSEDETVQEVTLASVEKSCPIDSEITIVHDTSRPSHRSIKHSLQLCTNSGRPETDNKQNNTRNVECESGHSLSNIKIVSVTSLSNEMFTKVPEVSTESPESSDIDDFSYTMRYANNVQSNNIHELNLKRRLLSFSPSSPKTKYKRVGNNECNSNSVLHETNNLIVETQVFPFAKLPQVYPSGSRAEILPNNSIRALRNQNIQLGRYGYYDAELQEDNGNNNIMEETVCDMNPLIMEGDEESEDGSGSNVQNISSSVNMSEITGHADKNFDNLVTIEILQNNTVTNDTIEDRLADINMEGENSMNRKTQCRSGSECTGDAGTSPAARSGKPRNEDDTTDCFKIYTPRANVYSCSPSKYPRNSWNGRTNTSAVDAEPENITFQIPTSSNTCDRTRLIPEVIDLKNLKFRVCGSDVVQMIIHNKYSVNVPIKTTAAASSNVNANRIKSVEAQTKTTLVTRENRVNYNIDNCAIDSQQLNLANTKDNCQHEKYVREGVISDIDDTKENLDPVITITKNSDHSNQNSTEEINLSIQKDSMRMNRCASGTISNSESYNCGMIGNQQDLLDTKNSPCFSNMCWSMKQTKNQQPGDSILTKINTQNLRVANYVSSSMEEQDQINFNLTQEMETNVNRFKVSIDLSKIRNVIDANPTLFSKTDEPIESLKKIGTSTKKLRETYTIKSFTADRYLYSHFKEKLYQAKRFSLNNNSRQEEIPEENVHTVKDPLSFHGSPKF